MRYPGTISICPLHNSHLDMTKLADGHDHKAERNLLLESPNNIATAMSPRTTTERPAHYLFPANTI
jgi:hypothetical protein